MSLAQSLQLCSTWLGKKRQLRQRTARQMLQMWVQEDNCTSMPPQWCHPPWLILYNDGLSSEFCQGSLLLWRVPLCVHTSINLSPPPLLLLPPPPRPDAEPNVPTLRAGREGSWPGFELLLSQSKILHCSLKHLVTASGLEPPLSQSKIQWP